MSEAGEVITDYLREKQQELKRKRLQALQDDNFFGVVGKEEAVDDDDNFLPVDDGGDAPAYTGTETDLSFLNKSKKAKPKAKKVKRSTRLRHCMCASEWQKFMYSHVCVYSSS